MKRRMVLLMVSIGILILTVALTSGCSMQKTKTDKVRDLEYTVLRDAEVPEAFMEEIEKRKQNVFKLTYEDGEYLYIAKGYGEQLTGGCSIKMKEMYLTENAICFATELNGPPKGERVRTENSYPYIVIKTEAIDLPVVFE